eukprot:Plantae.Rhodophyta-Hildenbrandia_rubra.ctg2783.p1 GENE.Plantae.Rhodophyta-Hildenbrandia_rubra.ctg2783~~Plantae.Rhodophyta-Hildenbrandia_rubra.ctg2783.p1  ORF type:complete len:939 (+),score=166.32 Plantae.Rhodophyta-Hildenbrandia_rubra.ctg2783:1966-4782(+)
MSSTVEAFVQNQRELLRLERDVELDEVSAWKDGDGVRRLVRAGLAVAKLESSDVQAGLRGRLIVALRAGAGRQLAWGQMRAGDSVLVLADGTNAIEGVLKRISEVGAEVMVNSWPEEGDGLRFSVVKVGSDVTFRRCLQALELLPKVLESPNHPAHSTVSVLFGLSAAQFTTDVHLSTKQEELLAQLNSSQKDAVRHALAAKDLAVIHGPPGTGKTSSVIALIRAAVECGGKVLFVAPSNIAVDNAAERLVGTGLKFARLGHPARVTPTVEPYLLENMLRKTDEWAIIRDIRYEMVAIRTGKTKDWSEFRKLRKEGRKREETAIKRLLSSLNVVLTTTVGAGSRILREENLKDVFDIVVIDEAAQAKESEALIALLLGRKVVLAGDPHQLPPTVLSKEAEKQGLQKSLLDRIFDSSEQREQCVKMLTIQYRMHKTISNWSSAAMYNSELIAAPEIARRTLTGMNEYDRQEFDEDGDAVFVFVDTAGCDCEEEISDESEMSKGRKSQVLESKCNRGEAAVVVGHIGRLIQIGIDLAHIAVISPYSRQVTLLRELLHNEYSRGLEIATIDSFQGREKDAVILSLVRSNDMGEVGFLKDDRRLNVAITRAKRHCIVIGDSETISRHPFLANLLHYIEEHGEYRSAIEYGIEANYGPRPPPEAVKKKRSNTRNKDAGEMGKIPKAKQRHPKRERIDVAGSPENGVSSFQIQVEREFGEFQYSKCFKKTFSANLTPLQRKIVHEVAEQHNLLHKSVGSGGDRRIIVSKIEKQNFQDVSKGTATVEGLDLLPENVHCETLNKFEELKDPENSEGDDKLKQQQRSQSEGVVPVSSTMKRTDAVAGRKEDCLKCKRATPRRRKKKPRAPASNSKIDDLLSSYGPSDAERANGFSNTTGPKKTLIVQGNIVHSGSSQMSASRRAVLRKELDKKIAQASKGRAKQSKK